MTIPYTIIPSIISQYQTLIGHAESLGMEESLDKVIDAAMTNLFENVNYKPESRYVKGIDIEHSFPKDIYFKMKNLSKETGANYSSILNFALDRYWYPYSLKIKEYILKITMSKTQAEELAVRLDLSDRCPVCHTAGFSVEYVEEKNKTYVHCTDEDCDFSKSWRDINNLLQARDHIDYRAAINKMYDALFENWMIAQTKTEKTIEKIIEIEKPTEEPSEPIEEDEDDQFGGYYELEIYGGSLYDLHKMGFSKEQLEACDIKKRNTNNPTFEAEMTEDQIVCLLKNREDKISGVYSYNAKTKDFEEALQFDLKDLYLLNKYKPAEVKHLIIVPRILDAVQVYPYLVDGYAVVASLQDGLNDDQIKLLQNSFDSSVEIILAYDNDDSGKEINKNTGVNLQDAGFPTIKYIAFRNTWKNFSSIFVRANCRETVIKQTMASAYSWDRPKDKLRDLQDLLRSKMPKETKEKIRKATKELEEIIKKEEEVNEEIKPEEKKEEKKKIKTPLDCLIIEVIKSIETEKNFDKVTKLQKLDEIDPCNDNQKKMIEDARVRFLAENYKTYEKKDYSNYAAAAFHAELETEGDLPF